MNDHEIDALAGTAAPITDAEVVALALAAPKTDLMEEIMSTPLLEPVTDTPSAGYGPPKSGWSPRRRLAALVAAAVIAAIVVVQPGRDRGTAWAAELLEVAESAPRLLIDGWEVSRADEFASDNGEMTFSDGDRGVDLHWRPAADHDGYVEDRAHSADLTETTDVNGYQATMFRYAGSTDFTTLWRQGNHSMELRGDFPTMEDYLAVVASVHAVDVDTWLSAMPDSVIRPDDRSVVIEEMLDGIPLPDGFDVAAPGEGVAVADRYHLGAHVAGGVACAWIEQWLDATTSGDEAAAAEAVTAMATSSSWPILLEMSAEGAYPQMVGDYADAMAGDGVLMGEPFGIGETYIDALGCDNR